MSVLPEATEVKGYSSPQKIGSLDPLGIDLISALGLKHEYPELKRGKNAQFMFLFLDGIDQETQRIFIVWISTRQLIDSIEKEGASLVAQR